ncbi:MAG: hypothetical protein WD738_09250 [Pirellulales bacterium]
MPRLTRSIPSYRKHRASGQAVVTLGGRDYYLGPWGTKASKFEYDRLVGEWLQQGRQFRRPSAEHDSEDRQIFVNQLIVAYLNF